MAVNCDPNELGKAAKCFECYNEKQTNAVQTYLLAVIAGVPLDPDALALAAKGFQALNPQQHQQVQDYLLCQIANQ